MPSGHVGRTRDVGERQPLVGGAAHLVLAIGDLDVLGSRLQHVRREPLRLVGDLVGRQRHRLAAHRQRARAVGAHSERAGARVAVDHLDMDRIDADPVRDDLREAGLVALAVRRAAGEEERLALDLAAAGWGLAYVDSVTVHHHPSPSRDGPGQRRAGIWRSRLLTAVMRRPAADVARVALRAVRSGRPGVTGLARALPDVPAALRHRQPVPAGVRADLRRLEAGA